MVAVAGGVVFVKISGRATFHSSVSFKSLVQELHQRGYERFVLDLTDCLIMDSTFLGVLAGVGLKMSGGTTAGNSTRVQLCNPNLRVAELVDNLGVSHFFQILNGQPAAPSPYEALPAATGDPSREEVSRTCLEAHRLLMEINPANIPKFKDVTKFLAEDLAKIQARHP